MDEDRKSPASMGPLAKIGLVVVICALAAFMLTYVAVGVAKPGSRAQHDVLKTVSGAAVVAAAPSPSAAISKPVQGYGEQPDGKVK